MEKNEVTINQELAFLRNLYNKAIDWGKASENPLRKSPFCSGEQWTYPIS
jgi:hypothetical protein